MVIIVTTISRNLAFCERAPATDQLREAGFLEDHEGGRFHGLGLSGRVARGGALLRLDRVDVLGDGAIESRDAKQIIRREAASRVGLGIAARREVETGGDIGGIGVVKWRSVRERGRESPKRGKQGHQTRDEELWTRHQEHWKKERKDQGTRV